MAVANPPLVPPQIGQFAVFGHSRMAEGAATMEDFGVSHKIARRLNASLSLPAQGGSCLCAHEGASIAGGAKYGGIGRLLQFATNPRTAGPYLPAWQAAILDWGLNDMGWMGPTTFAAVFPLGLRGAIARLRAGRIFEDSDAAITYTGASWSTLGLTSCNSGTGVRQVTTNGDSLSIAIPADFPGGAIALRFVTGAAGQGALWTITGTGSCAGVNTTHDTRMINGFDNGGTIAANGKLLNSVKRVGASLGATGALPSGSGTLVVTATTIGTVGYFDCCEIESPYPGPVGAGLDIRPINYSLYSAWPYPAIGDADLATVWNVVGSVAAEFDGGSLQNVFGLPIDSVINKNPAYFNPADNIHFNDLGHAVAADALAGIMQAHANPLKVTQSGGLFVPWFYPLDGTGAGNAFLNSWANFTGSTAGYRKDNVTGRVQIKGIVTKTTGAATDPIFTLPVGYRPSMNMDFTVHVYNGATYGTGLLRITPAGSVNITTGGSIAAGSANWMNATFQAEQ